ncbi:MAG: thymidylate kinase [Candidatus Micrarchaeota archaeon]|nr:thymidylate kinase [Candidatus Micrarchaeota archaeon]
MIVLEGIDGAGKSTLAKALSQELNLPVKSFPNYENIPVIKRYFQGEPITHEGAFLLLLGDILSEKGDFIADRFYFSTIAYAKIDLFKAIAIIETVNPWSPDVVLYLDVDFDKALERTAQKRGEAVFDDYDKNVAFLKEVKRRFDFLYERQYRAPWIKIDANQPFERVVEQSLEALKPYL